MGNNLIKNYRWWPGCDGNPEFFSGCGPITYDNFCYNGCRTCSLTMDRNCGIVAKNIYDPILTVCNMKNLNWGYCIRAIEVQCVVLVVSFYCGCNGLIECKRCPITKHITCDFCQHTERFCIPCKAATARLSMELEGKITACTFCTPTATFC